MPQFIAHLLNYFVFWEGCSEFPSFGMVGTVPVHGFVCTGCLTRLPGEAVG